MFCVGITGNIGSGKSTAMTCFHSLGITVIFADKIARELTKAGQPAFLLIKNHFGENVVNEDGELNRPLLRERIFTDGNHRLWLENLLHPLIRKTIKEQALLATSPYCVIEIPLLLKRADYPWLDNILVMLADEKKEVERVMQRDNCKETEALAILSTQPSRLELKELADDLLFNNGTKEQLYANIMSLHDKYLLFAVKKSS